MTHTPGPWRAVPSGPAASYIITGSDETPIAKTYAMGPRDPHADAWLLATAPQLLSMLRELTACAEDIHASGGEVSAVDQDVLRELAKAARVLIAKAEGEL